MRVGDVLDHVRVQDLGPELVLLAGPEPVQYRLPGPPHVTELGAVHLQHPELPLHEQDPRLDARNRPQREVGDPLDRQGRRDLDDQRVLAGERRIAASPGRRAEIGGELRPQVPYQEIDAQLGDGITHW